MEQAAQVLMRISGCMLDLNKASLMRSTEKSESNDLREETTYHCGPPSAARRVTVDDAVLSAPHCHLPRVTIHTLHSNTAEALHAARPNKCKQYKLTQRDPVWLAGYEHR